MHLKFKKGDVLIIKMNQTVAHEEALVISGNFC
jgi:hypothetical protein